MRDIEACNVKEMLLDGATKEELMKALEDEIESAQKEIDEAKADKEQDEADMDQIRMDLICSVIDYLDALGLLDADKFEDKDYEELNDDIKQIEREMMPQIMLIDALKKAAASKKKEEKKTPPVSESADEIIKKFLKSL